MSETTPQTVESQKGEVLKSEIEPRATVPRATVTHRYTDERKALADKADEANPEYKHVYKGPNATAEEIRRHRLKPVKWEDIDGKDTPKEQVGADVFFRGDQLFAQPRDDYEQTKLQGEEISKELVQQSMQESQDYNPDHPEHEDWALAEATRTPRSTDELRKRR